MAETTMIAQIGPDSHGTRMSLEDFARVEGQPGHLYELEKGVIVVVDVPSAKPRPSRPKQGDGA